MLPSTDWVDLWIRIAGAGPKGQPRGVTLAERIPWFATASRGRRWLLGVSGGADSVAMLHLLVENGFHDLVVCHLDHGLRADASSGDAEFVRCLAAELGLTCEIGRTEVARLMEESGESMETAARNARHQFFAECAGKFSCPRVILAHHADDQAETVLWNLLRGSHGLKGMREVRCMMTESGVELELVRPLLAITHTELVDWLVSNRKSWREDASNQETLTTRNRLRHDVIPLLAKISGRNPAEMLGRALEGGRDSEEIEAWAVKNAGAIDPQGRLHLPVVRSLPPAVQRAVVVAYLKEAGVGGIDQELLARVLALIDPDSPPAVNLPGGGWLRRRGGRLRIVPPDIRE